MNEWKRRRNSIFSLLSCSWILYHRVIWYIQDTSTWLILSQVFFLRNKAFSLLLPIKTPHEEHLCSLKTFSNAIQAKSTQTGVFGLHRPVIYLPQDKYPDRLVGFFPLSSWLNSKGSSPLGWVSVGIGAATLRQEAGMLSVRKESTFHWIFKWEKAKMRNKGAVTGRPRHKMLCWPQP